MHALMVFCILLFFALCLMTVVAIPMCLVYFCATYLIDQDNEP